ncbi:hypothetical protein D932_03628 [Enterococcus casseliflavus 14-MB-W-14]|nr:hypothetical protein D932_03628 [Enterococcus casseliflavus 14-MB-W-14]
MFAPLSFCLRYTNSKIKAATDQSKRFLKESKNLYNWLVIHEQKATVHERALIAWRFHDKLLLVDL